MKIFFPVVFYAFNHLLRKTELKSSFSLGEASLVSQIVAVLSTHAVELTYSKSNGLLFNSIQLANYVVFEKILPVDVFLVALTLGMILVGLLSIPTLLYTRKIATDKLPVKTQIIGSLTFYVFLLGFTFFAISPWIESFIKQEPFSWTFNYLKTTHSVIVNAVYLAGLMIMCGLIVPSAFKADLMSLSIHIRRKYFHVIALMMFVPSIHLEVRLLSVLDL